MIVRARPAEDMVAKGGSDDVSMTSDQSRLEWITSRDAPHTFDWERLGFTRHVHEDWPYRSVAYTRVEGQLEFAIVFMESMSVAQVGLANSDSSDPSHRIREKHAVSEDEALGWFAIWLADLAQYASEEILKQYSPKASYFRRKWPLEKL